MHRFFEPVRFLNRSPNTLNHGNKISTRRERLARAFLGWGGFHQGYTFQNDPALRNEELDIDANIRIIADASAKTNEASNIAESANRAMRAALIQQRLHLKKVGAMDSGLVISEDGRIHVEEWLALQNQDQQQEAGSSPQEGAQKEQQKAWHSNFSLGNTDRKGADEDFEFPEDYKLTPEEEASFARMKERLAGSLPKIAESVRKERPQGKTGTATKTPSRTQITRERSEKASPARFGGRSATSTPASKRTTAYPGTRQSSPASSASQAPQPQQRRPRRPYTPPQTDDFVMPVQREMSEEAVRVRQHVRAGKRKERAQGFRARLLGWVRDL